MDPQQRKHAVKIEMHHMFHLNMMPPHQYTLKQTAHFLAFAGLFLSVM